MRPFQLMLWLLGVALTVDAYPSLGRTISKLMSIQRRDVIELLGDLKYLKPHELSPVGRDIKEILLLENITTGPAQDFTTIYTPPGPLESPECAEETCCVWSYIAEELEDEFRGESGRCTLLARQAVRLGFHDAGTWSKSEGGGGADGSFVLAGEIVRPLNKGLEDINAKMWELYARFGEYGVSMADLIQMASTVATVVCPLGPRIRSFVGRNDSSTPAPDGRLPAATDDVLPLLDLFLDKTIDRGDLITLLGAHTIGQQRFEDLARAGDPHDNTPGVWDNTFYRDTVDNNTPKRVMKFHSDLQVANYNESRDIWGLFSDPVIGQSVWNHVRAPYHSLLYSQMRTRLVIINFKLTNVLFFRDMPSPISV